MSVTKTTLRYSYLNSLGDKGSKTFANVNSSVTNAQAQTFGQALTTHDIYPGGISSISKIEKISTTTDEIPVA